MYVWMNLRDVAIPSRAVYCIRGASTEKKVRTRERKRENEKWERPVVVHNQRLSALAVCVIRTRKIYDNKDCSRPRARSIPVPPWGRELIDGRTRTNERTNGQGTPTAFMALSPLVKIYLRLFPWNPGPTPRPLFHQSLDLRLEPSFADTLGPETQRQGEEEG